MDNVSQKRLLASFLTEDCFFYVQGRLPVKGAFLLEKKKLKNLNIPKLRCVGVAVSGSRVVGESRCGVVAMQGSGIVGETRCVGVPVVTKP